MAERIMLVKFWSEVIIELQSRKFLEKEPSVRKKMIRFS